MKRALSFMLSIIMFLSLAACDARRLVQGGVPAESGAAPAVTDAPSSYDRIVF